MTTLAAAIIIISIFMVLNGKETLYLITILLLCYSFPVLAFIAITIAVLGHHSD